MAPQLKKFCGLVARARLLSPAELERLYRDWRDAEPNQRDNLPSFVRYVVSQKKLTAEQVEQLIASPAKSTDAEIVDGAIEATLVPARDPRRSIDRRDLVMFTAGAILGGLAVAIPFIATRPKPAGPVHEESPPL